MPTNQLYSLLNCADGLERAAVEIDRARAELRTEDMSLHASRAAVAATRWLIRAVEVGAKLAGPLSPELLAIVQRDDRTLLNYWKVFVLQWAQHSRPEDFVGDFTPRIRLDRQGKVPGRIVRRSDGSVVLEPRTKDGRWPTETDRLPKADQRAHASANGADWSAACRVAAWLIRQQAAGATKGLAGTEQGERGAKTKPRRKRGRPQDADPKADKRLCEDWQAARRQGMTRVAFARERGIAVQDLIAAQHREKYRRCRDAE